MPTHIIKVTSIPHHHHHHHDDDDHHHCVYHHSIIRPLCAVAGRCGTAASRYSELSCSQSHVFDQLEAIAPRSASCSSLDEPADSSGCPSPDTGKRSTLHPAVCNQANHSGPD